MQQPESNIQIPDVSVIRSESSGLVAEAKAIEVTTHEEYAAAGAFVQRCARLKKSVLDLFAEPTAAAHKVHKFLTGLQAQLVAVPDEARAIADGSMATFLKEEERQRRELQAKLEAEAREREVNARIKEAVQLEANGDKAAADRILEEPVPAQVIELPRPTAAGVSMRKSWDYRIINPLGIARGFLVPDEKKMGQTVRAMGPDAAKLIGGIEVFERLTSAVRTA